MEQRLSRVDETLFQNPMMIPQTTEVPRPKLMNSDVKNGNGNAEERNQVFNEIGLVQDVLRRYISDSADGFTKKIPYVTNVSQFHEILRNIYFSHELKTRKKTL